MTLNEAELKQLMLAGLDGNSAAYRTLLDRLSRVLRCYYRAKLSRIGREATEAEDVMQDVLIALRHTYDPNDLFMPWIYFRGLLVRRHNCAVHLGRRDARTAPLTMVSQCPSDQALFDRLESAKYESSSIYVKFMQFMRLTSKLARIL